MGKLAHILGAEMRDLQKAFKAAREESESLLRQGDARLFDALNGTAVARFDKIAGLISAAFKKLEQRGTAAPAPVPKRTAKRNSKATPADAESALLICAGLAANVLQALALFAHGANGLH